MQNKQNTKAKVILIAIAILLCLALVVGITGAFYQAQRRATGTVKMDKGIVIDYTGFGKTQNEGTWLRETTISFKLFEDADVQPGEKISLNDAGIRANASSVDFYARVKLDYEFYNGETPVELADATKLIKTSSSFFGTNWVESGDGYYYYAAGSTLNKFAKTATTFVDLFATDAKFIIEGAGFTGATSDGEGGGFVVGDTSINKIVVYLTLETLQGDATAEQAQALGWEIVASAGDVVFAEATEKLETSVGKEETTENLNVSVNGAEEVPLNEVVFPYDTPTTLKFDSNNVEYITLTYDKDGVISTETFEETALNTITVKADSGKGKVTGYTVGTWSSSEYTGFLYSNNTAYRNPANENDLLTKPMDSGICVTGYVGNETTITIPSSVRVRERDFKLVLEGYSTHEEWFYLMGSYLTTLKYPCVLNGITTLNSIQDVYNLNNLTNKMTDEEFIAAYPKMEFEFKTLCVTSSILYSKQDVKEIDNGAFQGKTSLLSVTISNSIELIDEGAFLECSNLTIVNFGTGVKVIKHNAFNYCDNLNVTVADLDGSWVYAEDGTEWINGDYVEVKEGEMVDPRIKLNDRTVDIKRA